MRSALFLLAATLHAQSLQLAITGTGPIRAGNTIVISMTLVGGGGSNIAGLQELFTASTGGTVTAADGAANVAAAKHVQCATQGAGLLCLDVGLNANSYADGVIHLYSLAIPATATPGQATLTLSNVVAASALGVGVPITGSTVNFTLAAPLNPCDLDGSGTVDSADFQAAEQQVLGLAACTADLDGTGKCSVIDVQRIVNAALGGACKTGA